MHGNHASRRRIRLPGRLAACLLVAWWAAAGADAGRAAEAGAPQRIVSLNPSLTEILIALGARDVLVGVDDYSAAHSPEVADLPRVGGLFSPSLEAVVALAPDVVVLVPSAEQRDFRERLEALGVAVEVFRNVRFGEVLENIERLGAIAGREEAARRRIEASLRAREVARAATAGRARVRALLVLQRDPVFVVGRGSFIDEMLDDLRAENLARAFDDPYPRVAVEWVVAQSPDVLVDLSPDPGDALAYWSRWPSIRAVADERVVAIDAALISMPGPHLDRALEELARGLHGEAVGAAIAGAVKR